MKLLIFALLPVTSRANWHQVCYSGKIQIGNETWSQTELMAALHPQVNEAIVEVANHDMKLASFLQTQGECQIDCLEVVMQPTFSTLYGKLGQDFYSHHKKHIQEIFIEALSGAFTACYPHPPRHQVREVAEAIISHIGYAPPAHHTFPAGVPCPYEGYEHDFPLNDFLHSFEVTLMQVLQNKPGMAAYFDEQAKDCQKTCLQQTVPASAMTLFLHGNYDDYTGVDALTGAIQACFPDVPHQDINVLVAETKDVMAQAEAEASRQYEAETRDRPRGYHKETETRRRRWARAEAERQRKEQERMNEDSIPWVPVFGIIAAMSLALLIGVILGRRQSVPAGGSSKAYEMIPSIMGRKAATHSN